MAELVTSLDTYDVRFPTSRHLDGSDAMNPFPDYSAACHYVAPRAPGAGAQLHPSSVVEFLHPDGPQWSEPAVPAQPVAR